jgi:hypothetical protein
MPREGHNQLEGALEQLYQAPADEFTKRRDALAKKLRDAGAAAAAKSLRERRKPTQIAWVLNQLSRRYPDDIAELVDVGRDPRTRAAESAPW